MTSFSTTTGSASALARAGRRSGSQSPSTPRLTACLTAPRSTSTRPGCRRRPAGSRRRRRAQRLDDPGGGADDAVGAGLGGLAHLGAGSRPSASTGHPEGLGRADVEPDARARSPVPPRRPQQSVTAAAAPAGTSRACRSAAAGRRSGPGQPHSTTTAVRPGTPVEQGDRRAAGARRAPGRTSGRVAGSCGAPGATTRSAGSPHGTSPTAMVAGVSTRDDAAPRRSGSSPSTLTARARPARRLRPRRARRRTPSTGARQRRRSAPPPRPAAPRAAGPTRTAADDRGLDRAHQRRRPCRRRCRAGRRRRRATSTAASGMPRPAEAPAMSSASLTMTPSKPSSLAQQAEHRRRSGSPAGRGRQPGRRCARSSPRRRRPRPRRANGTSSRAARVVEVGVDRAAARGGCPARCRRGRGSAWRRPRRRPPAGRSTQAATCAATRAGSAPKLRVPITGLSGLLLTSATGPRSRSIPSAASSAPTAPAGRAGQVEVVDRAERGGPEHRAAGRGRAAG